MRVTSRCALILGLAMVGSTSVAAQIGRQTYSFKDRAPKTRMEKVIHKLLPSLVKVHGASGLKTIESYCTGVIVSDKGHILTLDLVLIQPGKTKVVLYDGTVCLVKVLPANNKYGVRMLKIGDEDLKKLKKPVVPVAPAKNQAHENGTFVVSLGNCYRLAEFSEKLSAMFGVVVARTKTGLRYRMQEVDYEEELIITDAPNNPGHYGGGLFTLKGEFIGLNARILDSKDTNTQISAAIPTGHLANYIKRFTEGDGLPIVEDEPNKVIPVYHGIKLFDSGRRRSPPAYVEKVRRGSPGFGAGLRPDDLIMQIDKVTILSCNEFYRRMKKHKPGDKVWLTYKRGSKVRRVQIQLEEVKK